MNLVFKNTDAQHQYKVMSGLPSRFQTQVLHGCIHPECGPAAYPQNIACAIRAITCGQILPNKFPVNPRFSEVVTDKNYQTIIL